MGKLKQKGGRSPCEKGRGVLTMTAGLEKKGKPQQGRGPWLKRARCSPVKSDSTLFLHGIRPKEKRAHRSRAVCRKKAMQKSSNRRLKKKRGVVNKRDCEEKEEDRIRKKQRDVFIPGKKTNHHGWADLGEGKSDA